MPSTTSKNLKTERGPAGMHQNTPPDTNSENEQNLIITEENFDDQFKKVEKKTFTLVRIEDEIVELYREIADKFNYKSHGPYINEILRIHALEKLGK